MQLLTFHANQIYAYVDDYGVAVECIQKAKLDQEPEGKPVKWNAYVNATMAFLNKDKEKLLKYRNQLAQGLEINAIIPDLDVVDALIANFDEPYSIAYERIENNQGVNF